MADTEFAIFRVLVPVPDIEAATKFYAALLQQKGERVSPGRHYFLAGGVVLVCYDARADGDPESPRPLDAPLYLAAYDLESAYERARDNGARFSDGSPPGVGALGSIQRRPWGERSFYFSDPFGNQLCVVDAATKFTSASREDVP